MLHGVLVSGTSTGVGKTWLSRGLARALTRATHPVAAIKPIETGVQLNPLDASALGSACGRPELAHLPGLVRQRRPLSPYAGQLAGERPVDVDALVSAVRGACVRGELAIVESAGGLLVPLTRELDTADLAARLALPLLMVAPNRLGVLSDALAYAAVARLRGLELAALVLTDGPWSDSSTEHNHRILAERLGHDVLRMPAGRDDDDALADAVESAGLLARVLRLAERSRERHRPADGGDAP